MIGVVPQLRLATDAQMVQAVAMSLIGSDRADGFTLDCALVRTVLWALTREGPTHILRLTNQLLDLATSNAGTVDEPALRSRFRRILDDLADAGDILELAGGRWHPAAVREVDLGGLGNGRLLVGGVPTTALPAELRGRIVHDRAFRRVHDDGIREAIGLPIEQLDSWAGAPTDPLAEWAKAILGSALAPYAGQDGGSSWRVYAPQEARRGAPQRWRWLERFDAVSGRLLADRRRIFGAREYRVIEVRQGRVERSGAILLPGEARRLKYAMDALAGNPVEAASESMAETLKLTLWSELPRPELRLFAALGSLEVPADRYYPRIWRISGPAREVAVQRLHALGVRLVSQGAQRGKS